jgi:pimeloyl-ACP methyl ester carboxylesterase
VHRPETVEHSYQANGLRFATLEWGEGPLVLLFHGFPDTARTWDQIGPAIARAGYRVVAPFLRGYAPSGIPERDTDSRTLAEDVVALIAALGADRARLVGHDWGAEAVNAATALAPERVERLVSVAVPNRAAITFTPSLVWALRHFFSLTLPGAEARFARDDYAMVDHLCRRWSPTWRFTVEDLEPVKNAFAAPGCLHAALGYYRAAKYSTPDFMRGPIDVPTLNIAGGDDPNVSPAVYERTRKHYRGRFEVVTISGGHFCHRESPEQLLAALIPFLA